MSCSKLVRRSLLMPNSESLQPPNRNFEVFFTEQPPKPKDSETLKPPPKPYNPKTSGSFSIRQHFGESGSLVESGLLAATEVLWVVL